MSRICVKKVPKYINEDRLREIFSQKGEVTDAKLIRTSDGKSREFGFIGYRTEQEAEEAIRYFNGSFLDASKIICEVARIEGDPNIPRPWSRYTKEKEKKSAESKNQVADVDARADKKSDPKANEIDDPKLNEFLQVMQPRSKSKLWADDIVTPSLDHKGKVIKERTQTKQEDQKRSKKKLDSNKGTPIEDVMDEGIPESEDVALNDVVSDMDYFKSRVKKDWSDSESDSDESESGSSEEDDDDKDDGDEEDTLKHSVSGDQKLPEDEDVSAEADGELMNSEGAPSSSPQADNEGLQNGRLFVRNLPYGATEDDLAELFGKFGDLVQVHLVIDKETKRSKGFAYVLYKAKDAAARALEELDHSVFQGRLLHVIPAKAKDPLPNQENHVPEGKAKSFKQKREEGRKESEAGGNTRSWNSLFMRADTIVENIARKNGLSKGEFLDRDADDLAVKIALGETHIIAETMKALRNAGVNVTSLENFASGKSEGVKRSNHVILVKNLPFSSTETELSEMFGKFGSLDKIILPPTRTIAVAIYLEPAEARGAFKGLAYKRYKDGPLYLEWAPSDILGPDPAAADVTKNNMVVGEQEAKKVLLEQQVDGISQDEVDPDRVESRSLFVKNLNFKTTDEILRKHISENMKEGKISSVRIKKHLKNGKNVSAGFGFLEFDNAETASNICRDLQGTVLDGHALTFQLCYLKKDEKVNNKTENDLSSTKLIVRNVAFEATEKDLRQLFNTFGQIKSLRLPTRFGKHRGFGFVEFVTKQEAQNALKALSNTHLYGRHLVLEKAKEGETLDELRTRTAAHFANDDEGFQNPAKKRKMQALSE